MRIITNPFEICEALGVGMQGSGELGFALAVDDDGKPLHLLIGSAGGWRVSQTSVIETGDAGSGGILPTGHAPNHAGRDASQLVKWI